MDEHQGVESKNFFPTDGERLAVDPEGSLEIIWSLSSQPCLYDRLSRELFKKYKLRLLS